MENMKKLLSLVLAVCMLMGMASVSFAETVAATAPAEEAREANTLVVGYLPFSEKFSPFFADTGYDTDVVKLVVGDETLAFDRQGGLILNAIEGETVSYNDTDYKYTGVANVAMARDEAANQTTYTIKLRDDVKFSDGQPLTADDLIFSYYVYLDPAYVGSATLGSYNIVGVKDYQTQTTSDVYAKYETMAQAIAQAGADHAVAEGDPFTKEQFDAYQALTAQQKEEWIAACQQIVDFVYTNYGADYAMDTVGKSAEEIATDDGMKVALGMAMWGYGEAKDGVLTTADGKTFTLAETTPTIADYFDATYAAYAGDGAAFVAAELNGVGAAVITEPLNAFISEQAKADPGMASGVPNISGITKLDDYTVSVVTDGYQAPAIYSISGIIMAPLHYYGDVAQYDYANNKFGHPLGDLSIVSAKTTQPMGYGPYKFIKYENKVVYLEANEYYYKGVPKIKSIQLKETLEADKISGLTTGTLDLTDPSFGSAAADEIKAANSNGELDGDKVVINTVDNLGYGYIGLNADTMLVGTDPASAESKYLRSAFTTVLSVYRDVAIDSYYGERASVINYPMSNTSWAAPQKTDEDYKVAFSTNINGEAIYTAEMTADQKYEAALNAAIEYLKAAGYTWDEATSKFTAAPEGAQMDYELIIPADGNGDHPSFGIATDAQAAFEKIGLTLTINDPADSNVLWDKLDAGSQNMWAAAWQATIDPDMYQIYHSSGIVGRGGSDSNHYHIDDAELDQLIVDARTSDDQSFRKATYKACLDKIIEWAVEIPVYQRQNCFIFSPERVNMDTLTKDITTFYSWWKEIETLELK
ncbi:MAG: ABC transporter substrate-binding protein [Clostridia bacterium]